jgi:lipopolysaccharide transport system permease protein
MPSARVVPSVREALSYRDLLKNLTQRELRGRFRRTFLGWGWSLMQPVLMTAVYAIMLGWYFKVTPEPGDPSGIDTFAFFLLAGVLPWNFFASSLMTSMGTIVGAGGLMTRVWFPRLLLPLSTILALAVSLCIELGILTIVISVVEREFLFHLTPITLLLVIMELLFTSGIAFFLAASNVRFRDVEYLTGVLLLAYFYMTPIIYSVTFIPDTSAFGTALTWRDIALANPMARFAMAYRNVLYDVRLPGLPTMLWITGWSLFSAYFGTRYFVRRSDRFAEMM